MSDLDSPQLKYIHEWLQAIQTKDLDHLAKCLPKDYRHTYYPRSLGKPEQTKEEFLEYIAGLYSIWPEFEQTVHSITEAPGKIIVHVTYADKTSVRDGMSRESILIKHIVTDEDGNLKTKMGEEFTDSKAYHDGMRAVAAARAKGQ